MNSKHNELFFCDMAKTGYLLICKGGDIWRLATTHGKNNYHPIKPKKAGSYAGRYGLIHTRLNGTNHYCSIHRIVWTYFNGTIPDELQINHKNGNKHDNRLENLETVTRSENMKHAINVIGTKTVLRGEQLYQAKLNSTQVIEIRRRHLLGESVVELCSEYGVSNGAVWAIVNNKSWKHLYAINPPIIPEQLRQLEYNSEYKAPEGRK